MPHSPWARSLFYRHCCVTQDGTIVAETPIKNASTTQNETKTHRGSEDVTINTSSEERVKDFGGEGTGISVIRPTTQAQRVARTRSSNTPLHNRQELNSHEYNQVHPS